MNTYIYVIYIYTSDGDEYYGKKAIKGGRDLGKGWVIIQVSCFMQGRSVNKTKPCGYLEEECSGKDDSKCKGPEAGEYSRCVPETALRVKKDLRVKD